MRVGVYIVWNAPGRISDPPGGAGLCGSILVVFRPACGADRLLGYFAPAQYLSEKCRKCLKSKGKIDYSPEA